MLIDLRDQMTITPTEAGRITSDVCNGRFTGGSSQTPDGAITVVVQGSSGRVYNLEVVEMEFHP